MEWNCDLLCAVFCLVNLNWSCNRKCGILRCFLHVDIMIIESLVPVSQLIMLILTLDSKLNMVKLPIIRSFTIQLYFCGSVNVEYERRRGVSFGVTTRHTRRIT